MGYHESARLSRSACAALGHSIITKSPAREALCITSIGVRYSSQATSYLHAMQRMVFHSVIYSKAIANPIHMVHQSNRHHRFWTPDRRARIRASDWRTPVNTAKVRQNHQRGCDSGCEYWRKGELVSLLKSDKGFTGSAARKYWLLCASDKVLSKMNSPADK